MFLLRAWGEIINIYNNPWQQEQDWAPHNSGLIPDLQMNLSLEGGRVKCKEEPLATLQVRWEGWKVQGPHLK